MITAAEGIVVGFLLVIGYFERLYLLDDLVFELFHLELVLLLAILCVC